MDDDIYQQKIHDAMGRLLQARFGLWNSLITVNGVLLGVLSLSTIASNIEVSSSIKVVAVLCLVSLILLVYCHASTMQTYYRQTEILLDAGENLTDRDKDADLKRSVNRHRWTKYCERASVVFLAIEASLVVYDIIQ